MYSIPVSPQSQNKLRGKLRTESKWTLRYKEYGGKRRNNRNNAQWEIKPCKRMLYPKHQIPNILKDNQNQKIQWPGDNLFAYQAVWIIENGRTPRAPFFNESKICLSHICGLPKQSKYSVCIEPTHIVEEQIQINLDRKNCHRLIRMYEKHMIRPHGYNKHPINHRPFGGPIYTTNITKEDKLTVLTKYMHIKRSDAEELAKGNCGHNPHCFINYG